MQPVSCIVLPKNIHQTLFIGSMVLFTKTLKIARIKMNIFVIFTVFLVLKNNLVYTQICQKENECENEIKSHFNRGKT